MREIKFRAWDDFQKKYVFTGFSVIGEVTCFGGMESVIHETWENRSAERGYSGTIEAWNDFTVEQYTGLKDKNGREIYEGDITKDKQGRMWEIYWSDEYASFWAKLIRGEDDKCRLGHNFEVTTWAEVIGNIHETPAPVAGEKTETEK